MQTTSSRITFVDFARTTGIFLIVMGHAMGRMLHGGGLLYKYFYTFHVPLFFFISGYLFSCGKNGIGAFLYKKVKTLLVPYFCFGFISLVIFKLLGSFTKENLAVN
ncbi:MAG: acyltransferase family protein, partial [Christensenella sp.]